jgi:hypothetical protein
LPFPHRSRGGELGGALSTHLVPLSIFIFGGNTFCATTRVIVSKELDLTISFPLIALQKGVQLQSPFFFVLCRSTYFTLSVANLLSRLFIYDALVLSRTHVILTNF